MVNLERNLGQALKLLDDQEMVDVTRLLDVLYTCEDRTIRKAYLLRGPLLLIICGLRSDILDGFERFLPYEDGELRPCDIPGIVPLFALMSAEAGKALALSAFQRQDGHVRAILGLESEDGSVQSIASRLKHLMNRWAEWTDVLLDIVEKDPATTDWLVDWREFLSGESGFFTMEWYNGLPYEKRLTALDRIVMASEALLNSVLSREQLEAERIQRLRTWLRDLEPLPHVFGYATDAAQRGVA
ncbi:MAG: hypothetical protein KGY80_07655 [Candidatus Thorarchaeota archaeon]|nr:hypothetical protein [Candidatus Thorarchaeota archaeon]